MFTQNEFNVFQREGLEERMDGIRTFIQPRFRELFMKLQPALEAQVGIPLYLHVAKHARRTVNPPKDTWMAICHNARGYKKHPHFQVGLFDDRAFVWLAFIYEMPNKALIAERLRNIDWQSDFPDLQLAGDHMRKDADNISDMSKDDIDALLIRFRDVKKADLLIGFQLPANDPLLADDEAFTKHVANTFERFVPLYQQLVL